MFQNKSQIIKEHMINLRKHNFDTAMKYIESFATAIPSDAEYIEMIDYTIKVVKNDIQSSYIADIFYKDDPIDTSCLFPLYYYDENNKGWPIETDEKIELDFSSDTNFLTVPWDKQRLINVVKLIFGKSFIFHKNNHMSFYFPIIDLCYIYNGLHSSSVGITNRSGKIISTVCELEKEFSSV